MNTKYGFKGGVQPEFACKDIDQNFTINEIQVLIKDSVFEVGYDDQKREQEARELADNLINSWRVRNNIRMSVDFTQTWKPNDQGGKFISVGLTDSVPATDRASVSTFIRVGTQRFVKQFDDSYSFTQDIELAKKALQDKPLSDALRYFGEEVVNDKRPHYGIYKAIETLTDALGKNGRSKLAALAGKSEKYVGELMKTANSGRHPNPRSRKLLSESECRSRAKVLIQAYAYSIKNR